MGCEHVHTLGVNCFTPGARLIGCGSRLRVRRLGPTMADVGSVRPEAVVDPASLTRVALFAQLPAEELADLAGSLGRGVTLAGRSSSSAATRAPPCASWRAGGSDWGSPPRRVRRPSSRSSVRGKSSASWPCWMGSRARPTPSPPRRAACCCSAGRSFCARWRPAPGLAIRLLGVLAQRLRRDAQLLEEAAFLDVPGRLASVLLRLAEAPAPPAEGPEVLPRGLTQTELARLVGATRESVSKWLGNFERRGLIGREGGRIAVLEPDELVRQRER